eukprot:TRINITY_DN33447_c0_g1_i1.p1 TRINITY_DN33447_c0_g1~~TRINITY_DN33447_c0_g1_i1.p1  ORF type:complete len:464 (+),score=75.12 TRINITY_DN33447_c0_g1_i1:40-1392(+)
MPPAWAEPRVDLLDVREDAQFGQCAVAASDIDAGQPVLTEVPVLDAPLKSLRFAAQDEKLQTGTLVKAGSTLFPENVRTVDVGILDAFLASDEVVQRHVLSMQSDVDPSSPMRDSVRKAADILQADSGVDVETVEKVLLIGRVNAYAIGHDRQALFLRGRLIPHACNANCIFVAEAVASKDGSHLVCGSFKARRAISKGELLTISYVAEDFAAAPREQRRHYILCQKGFACCCKACDGEDEFARWPCPSCRPRGPDGRLAEHQLKGCTAVCTERRSPPWKSQCGKAFADEEVVVEGSKALANEALLSIYMPPAESKASSRNALLARVVQCFGQDHSVTQSLLRAGAMRAVQAVQPLAPTTERLACCHEFLVSAGWPLGIMPIYGLYKALIARAQAEVKAKTAASPEWLKLVTDATNCAYVVEGPDSANARTGLVITRLMATVALQEMQQE